MSSSGGGLPGAPTNFNSNSSYTWPLLTSSAGVTGFDLAKIRFLTSEFAGDLEGGTFSLALTADEKSISLLFTPNQPPVTSPAFFTRDWDRTLKIDIAELLEKFTRDPDGDARALVAVGASTNGTTITSDGTSLVFTPTDNVREIIHYWVQDVRAYRPGDTVRVAEGTITIQPIPEALPFSAYHAIEINWQGEPGQRYQVQSRLQMAPLGERRRAVHCPPGKGRRCSNARTMRPIYRIIVVK